RMYVISSSVSGLPSYSRTDDRLVRNPRKSEESMFREYLPCFLCRGGGCADRGSNLLGSLFRLVAFCKGNGFVQGVDRFLELRPAGARCRKLDLIPYRLHHHEEHAASSGALLLGKSRKCETELGCNDQFRLCPFSELVTFYCGWKIHTHHSCWDKR